MPDTQNANTGRKRDHIGLCANTDVESLDKDAGFNLWALEPCAIPDFPFEDVRTGTRLFGRDFPLPIMIPGMTGGVEEGARVNRNLARAASKWKIPMGIGSQRVALDDPSHLAMFSLKEDFPELFLIANIGLSELRSSDQALEIVERCVRDVKGDALAIHVNLMQELIQPEGERSWMGKFEILEYVVKAASVPIYLKEVGSGMDVCTARRLATCGVKAIDVGGRGGTSWAWIESQRETSATRRSMLECFRDWGLPTGIALQRVVKELPEVDYIATGGVRTPIHVAKALALGAKMVGVGLPMFRAGLVSAQAVDEQISSLAEGLRIVMYATGSRSLADLSSRLVPKDTWQGGSR